MLLSHRFRWELQLMCSYWELEEERLSELSECPYTLVWVRSQDHNPPHSHSAPFWLSKHSAWPVVWLCCSESTWENVKSPFHFFRWRADADCFGRGGESTSWLLNS
jgi:hypothetical protein